MTMTLETALLAAVGTLTGALGSMALWFKAQFLAITAKLNECEDDRNELWRALAENGIHRHEDPPLKLSRRPRDE